MENEVVNVTQRPVNLIARQERDVKTCSIETCAPSLEHRCEDMEKANKLYAERLRLERQFALLDECLAKLSVNRAFQETGSLEFCGASVVCERKLTSHRSEGLELQNASGQYSGNRRQI